MAANIRILHSSSAHLQRAGLGPAASCLENATRIPLCSRPRRPKARHHRANLAVAKAPPKW